MEVDWDLVRQFILTGEVTAVQHTRRLNEPDKVEVWRGPEVRTYWEDEVWDYYKQFPESDYAMRLFRGGRGFGKRAMLEKIRARATKPYESAIPQTKLLTLDPKTVVWRCIRPAFLTDPRGMRLTRAILERKRGKNGTSSL
ncbi:hypothetical protein SEA_BRUHMOMENT_7 [Arthrobacter phage BruhMoment]|nr:hypothetical protein SEA_BRUHMOMENT_7 [Arthrobacter phage BruhMoment]